MSGSANGGPNGDLAAVSSILGRSEITLTPDDVVSLLAYLRSTRAFQNDAITALASMASGHADWDAIERMVSDAELSDRILKRLVATLSAGGAAK